MLETTDDGRWITVKSRPILPPLLGIVLLAVAVALVVWYNLRTPRVRFIPEGLEHAFQPEVDAGEVLVAVGVPLALGWALFELWRSRRFETTFDREKRELYLRRYWPPGSGKEVKFGFDEVTAVNLGGQMANRGGLLSTGTVELTVAGSLIRITGWVVLDEANHMQLWIRDLVGIAARNQPEPVSPIR